MKNLAQHISEAFTSEAYNNDEYTQNDFASSKQYFDYQQMKWKIEEEIDKSSVDDFNRKNPSTVEYKLVIAKGGNKAFVVRCPYFTKPILDKIMKISKDFGIDIKKQHSSKNNAPKDLSDQGVYQSYAFEF